jgi:sugar lactone lactonase YvrE
VGNFYIADSGNNRIREVTMAGTITTFAGTGAAGYTGDNGPAVSATLNKPSALAIDSANNLYILDTNNSVVREVSTAGTITTVAGNGTVGYSGDGGAATSAALNLPYGLGIDSSGNLYIADSGNNVVREVSTAGVITTIIGDGTPGFSGDGGPGVSATLSNPQGLAVDSYGNLYVSDQGNQRVRELNTPSGSVMFPTTAVGATSSAVTVPLEVNTPGTTITAVTAPVSQGGRQEYTVTATGCALNTALAAGTFCNFTVTFSPGYAGVRGVPLQVSTSAGTFSFGMAGIGMAPQAALTPGIITIAPPITSGPNYFPSGGIVFDSAGNYYAAVNTFTISSELVEVAAGTGAVTNLPVPSGSDPISLGLAVDSAGNVYISNPSLCYVAKVAPGSSSAVIIAGTPSLFFTGYNGGSYSGDGGLATSATLNTPTGLAIDSAHNLYIADTYNNRIRKVSAASGIITTVAGNGTGGGAGDNGPATSAELNYPSAVAVDSVGNLYIADTSNNRIRKVEASGGIIATVAGDGTAGYSGDNGLATSAELNYPTGVVVDSAGDIYITDGSNDVIRMVNTAGIITTVAGNGTVGSSGNGIPATSATLQPFGLALDNAGNLYIVDASEGIRIVNVSTGALNFASAQVGSSTTQTVAVTDIGNLPLTFAVPASGQNPTIPAGFTLDGGTSCPQLSAGSQPSTLASGASCGLAINFVTGTTSVSGTASIADNAVNGSLQTVQLSGGAGETFGTTTTINVATPYYGQTQVSATILSTGGTLTPVGSVVFTVDGAVQPAVTVNSAGVATLPATVSNALALGSHTIAAAYTSSSAGSTNSNGTRIFTVGQPPSVTVVPSSTSLSVAPGSSATDTITVTPVGGYTGTLAFSCKNLPQNATCSFLPATVALTGTSGAQSVVVTIQTAGGTAELNRWNPFPSGTPSVFAAAVFWAPGLLTLTLAGRKRRTSSRSYYLILLLALVAATGVLTGCGGSSAAGSTAPTAPTAPTTPSAPVTPAGTSTVQIAATNAGTQVQSFTLALTVQ